MLQVVPNAIPNGSITIHARVELTASTESGGQVSTIVVPIFPFSLSNFLSLSDLQEESCNDKGAGGPVYDSGYGSTAPGRRAPCRSGTKECKKEEEKERAESTGSGKRLIFHL